MMASASADAPLDHRTWRIVLAVAVGVVVWRCAVFAFWPHAFFDSDQAIFGLMAKHMSEGRAFPLYMYGQTYLLAVEAWMAVPLFLVAGISVATLKLPLVVINVVVVWLLLRIFVREAGLPPWAALIASLPFLIPAPGTAARFVETSGGNLEPFLYTVLLWVTRSRPNWGGVVLGIGFLHREFTIYALIALLVIEAAHGTLFTPAGVRRRLVMMRVTAEVWLVALWLKQYSTPLGPGSTVAGNPQLAVSNVGELLGRICIDPLRMLDGLRFTFTEHLPRLFGTVPERVSEYAITSSARQGLAGWWILLLAIVVIAVVRIAMHLARERAWRQAYDPCVYLALVGAMSIAAYSTLRCGVPSAMRYELLSVLGATGLFAWYLQTEQIRRLAAGWMLLVMVWAAPAVHSHARIWGEYLRHPPVTGKQIVIRSLELQGVRYASTNYWLAYYVSFMTHERIIVTSEDVQRISSYKAIVNDHASEAWRIVPSRCDGGRELMRNVYLCPPQQ